MNPHWYVSTTEDPQLKLQFIRRVARSRGFWGHNLRDRVNTTDCAPEDSLPGSDWDFFLWYSLSYCSPKLYSFWALSKWCLSSCLWPASSTWPLVMWKSSQSPVYSLGLCNHTSLTLHLETDFYKFHRAIMRADCLVFVEPTTQKTEAWSQVSK